MVKKWNDFVREFKSAQGAPSPAEGMEAYIDSKMQELKDLVDGFSEGHSLIYEWKSGGDHRLDINFSAGDLSVGYEFDIDDLRVSKVVGDEVDTEFGGDVHSLEEGLDIIEKDIQSVLGISEKLLTEAYSEKSAPERLAFWEDFLHRFKSARNRARREISPEDYARMKDADLFHDDEPRCDFLDEWDLEGIKADWKGGIVRSRVYGSEKDFRIVQFDGFKNPEIGDIVVYFRFCAWLFKPDAEFNYAFSSSAVSSGNSNMWDDIQYMDRFCRSYRFGLRKDEIPAVVRTKATRKIRPVYGEEGHGYKIGRKRIEDGRGFKYESLASFEEFGEWIDEARGKKRRKVPAKYLTGPHPGKMRKEIDTFIGKKQYKKDWDADYTSGKGGKGKRVKTKKSAATKAYQRMFGKKED